MAEYEREARKEKALQVRGTIHVKFTLWKSAYKKKEDKSISNGI